MTVRHPALLEAITIATGSNAIRMTEDGVALTVSIVPGTYFLRGDGAADDLLKVLVDALDAHTGTNTYAATLALSADPAALSAVVTISRATGANNFMLSFADVLTTLDTTLIGFPATNTANNGSDKVSTLSPPCIWVSPEPHVSFEPGEEVDARVSRAKSGKVRAVKRSADHEVRTLVLDMVDGRRVFEEQNPNDTLATFQAFRKRVNDGTRFELHLPTLGTYPAIGAMASGTEAGSGWHLGEGIARTFRGGENVERAEPGLALYSWSIDLLGYVA